MKEKVRPQDYEAGRNAYDQRIPWSSQMPRGWRVGWIARQSEIGAERASLARDARCRAVRKPKSLRGS